MTIAHGGGIAGSDIVPCPGLAVGFAVAKEQPAHTKHATAWETKGTMFFLHLLERPFFLEYIRVLVIFFVIPARDPKHGVVRLLKGKVEGT